MISTSESLDNTTSVVLEDVYLTKGKPVLTDRLKTRESYRKCKLNQEVYEILERKRKTYQEGYIFPKSPTTPNEPLPKTTLRKMMHKYMDKAKLPKISPHGFRHTKATMFMSVCKTMAEVKAAAKFMGHSVDLHDILHQEIGINTAIDLVLYVMKRQLFLDGNKRTAIIFANHYLISNALGLIVIPAELVENYKTLLIAYYEDENKKAEIVNFLQTKCWIKLK